DAPIAGMEREREGRYGDHHRVASADLGELLGTGCGRYNDRPDQLVWFECVAFDSGEELAERDGPDAADGLDLDGGSGREQRRMRVARWRRRPEVAGHGATVADLRRADGTGRQGKPRQSRSQLGDDRAVGDARAQPDIFPVHVPLA